MGVYGHVQAVTIAEFTLGQTDFYDVSLVDGFNIPIVVRPENGNCSTAGCDGDLKDSCPLELAVKSSDKVTACRSACDKFNTDEYCCRGEFSELDNLAMNSGIQPFAPFKTTRLSVAILLHPRASKQSRQGGGV